MSGISKKGFTLLELLVVIGVITFVATILLPRVWPKNPLHDVQQFEQNFNNLTRFAWQQAVINHKTYKIEVHLAQRRAWVEMESDKTDSMGKIVFEPVKGSATPTSYTWSKTIEIKNFYVDGFDEMNRRVAGKTTEVWFYISADGKAQAVIINLVQTTMLDNKYGLVLNPYSALFKRYDTFQQ